LAILRHAATLKPRNASVHYQLFIALSRLKRKEEAQQELAIFNQLEEARKSQSRQNDDADVENPEPAKPPR
jgi:Flp pilus assembly protein TadD